MKTTTTETTAIDAATATPATTTTQSAWKGKIGSIGKFVGMAAAFIAISELYEFGKKRITAAARKAEAEAAEAARAEAEDRLAIKIGAEVGRKIDQHMEGFSQAMSDLAKGQIDSGIALRAAIEAGFDNIGRSQGRVVSVLEGIHESLKASSTAGTAGTVGRAGG